MSLYETLQKEVGEWSRENFGDQPNINPFIGTGEEAGELADDLELDSEPSPDEVDAFGDILVYTADFCERRSEFLPEGCELNMQEAYEEAQNLEPKHDEFFREWTAARGQLERSILKQRQGIRLDEDRVGHAAEQKALARMLCALENFVEERGYTLEECVEAAWYDEVIDREWDSSYTN